MVGAFGHSVAGGLTLVHLSMAADSANRGVHAALLAAVESGPAFVFQAMGLLGTVLGLLLLAVALWQARVAPRWVGPVLGAFLVVEFAGSAVGGWSSEPAVVLYLVALTALAATVLRSPVAAWRSGADAVPATPEGAARITA